MPDELTVEVFEGDFSRNHMVGGGEAEAEDAIENCAVAAIFQEEEEGDEGGKGVKSTEMLQNVRKLPCYWRFLDGFYVRESPQLTQDEALHLRG